jgi:hypothetical protein
MLRALDKAGSINLPAPKKAGASRPRKEIVHLEHNMSAVECGLDKLRPLTVELIDRGHPLAEFKSLIDQYHYLGFGRTVGANMKYIVRSNDGTTLACLLFGSAAWSCKDRDEYIGWSREQRSAHLSMLTNNTRFLILPNINVPHLASHILSRISRRVSTDWEKKYGHPILMLETFVDQRFRGTCYKAANWVRVGRTTGRGRDDRHHARSLPKKDIYLLPLTRSWQKSLLARSEKGGAEHAV